MSNFCLVTQRIGAFVGDSPDDDDRKPDHKSVNGSVTFTPKLKDGDAVLVTDEDGVKTVSVVPIVGEIVDGVLSHEGEPGVYLFAGGENSNPSTIVYTVTYSGLTVGKQVVKLKGTSLEAIPGEEIDLSGLIPVAGTPGSGITRGEKGDPFRYEDFTEEQLANLKGEKGDPGEGDVTWAELNPRMGEAFDGFEEYLHLNQPIILSSPATDPLPGRIYLVTG